MGQAKLQVSMDPCNGRDIGYEIITAIHPSDLSVRFKEMSPSLIRSHHVESSNVIVGYQIELIIRHKKLEKDSCDDRC